MYFKIIDKKEDILKENERLFNECYNQSTIRYILGINKCTDELLKHFKQKKLQVKGIIDDYTNLRVYYGIPIVKMNEINNKNSIIISCVIDGKLITAIKNLKNRGLNKIISYVHLCLFDKDLNIIHYCSNNRWDIENNNEKYNWLYEILNDDDSKKTLEYIIDFRYNFNIKVMDNFKYNLDKQYFEKEVIAFNNNEVFVDCGGFDGKTTEQFIKICPTYKQIYYFEPAKQYFEQSLIRLKKYERITFLNKGTYKKDAKLRFSIKDSESSISDKGKDTINVVKLDDIIKGKVTFIKMDVEGAEYDSLIGAEKIIKKYKPKLAICVYHNQEDFWRIPQLVLKYNPDYKVYLRHYTEGILETVMYFI